MWDVRVSTSERQAYAERLADAYAVGCLDYEEFHERHEQLFEMKTHGEIRVLFDGLPAPQAPLPPPPAPLPPPQKRSSLSVWAVAGLAAIAALGTFWLPVASYGFAYLTGEVGHHEYIHPDPIGAELIDATLNYAQANSLNDIISVTMGAEFAEVRALGPDGQPREYIVEVGADFAIEERQAYPLDNELAYPDEPLETISVADLKHVLEQGEQFALKELGVPEGGQPTSIDVYGKQTTLTFEEGYLTMDQSGALIEVATFG